MHPSVQLLHARRRLRRPYRVPAYRAARTVVAPEPAADMKISCPTPQTVTAQAPLGCLVVRRITDRFGQPWTVRELSAEGSRAVLRAGHDHELIFQCTISGVGTEVRRSGRSLESLTDAALAALLERASA